MLSLNIDYIYKQFKIIAPFNYISGLQNRDEYISKYRPEYPVLLYANSHLPLSAKILCVNMGWRGYFLNRALVFDHEKNPDFLYAWLQEADISIELIQKRLQKKGISHILIRTDLFGQWLQRATPMERRIWEQFQVAYCSTLAVHLNYSLYQIN
jgi:hypothetical protein